MDTRKRRRILYAIAAPAAVAIWSGWVGLGGMCGFGLVKPFPGITSWHLNTAITLPIGVEAYAAYAIGIWLNPETPEQARRFARRSAIGALILGMLGQVAYHLLAAHHATRAPTPVVVLVACIPVVTLGMAAALTHLLHAGEPRRDAMGDLVNMLGWPEHSLADDRTRATEAEAEAARLRAELDTTNAALQRAKAARGTSRGTARGTSRGTARGTASGTRRSTASGTPGGTADETAGETEQVTPDETPRQKATRLALANPDISVRDLAAQVGVPPSTADRWKRADVGPRLVAAT